MSIEEFLKQFNDIIPFSLNLRVGGARTNLIKTDDEHKSYSNFKGRMYPFYKKDITGVTTEWVPLEEIDAHLDLIITCPYPHTFKWEECPKSTKKSSQHFVVRILTDEDRQVGFIMLDLNKAGDIDRKYCSYYNENVTHNISHSVDYSFDQETKKMVKDKESLSFASINLEEEIEEEVTFYRKNGVLTCVTISKHPLRNSAYISLLWHEDDVKRNQMFFSRYYNNVPIKAGTYIASDSAHHVIIGDYQNRLETIEILETRLEDEKDPKPYMRQSDFDRIRDKIKDLKDPKNDMFSGFVGELIGNTIIKDGSKEILVFETLKDGYHYFTSLDVTGLDAFNYDSYGEYHDSPLYFEAMKNTPKIPMFRTRVTEEEEVLVPFGDQITEEETKNYEWFKSYCTESFATIEKGKMSSLTLDKYSVSENKHKTNNNKNPKNKHLDLKRL